MLGLLSVGWMYLRRRTGLVFAIIGIAVALALVLSLPRMGDIDTQEGSARTRLDHWSYGLQLFKTHPIMGVGVGNFADIGNYTHTAHNSLVLVMAETGFVGTFFWISMLLCFFMHLRAIRGEEPGAALVRTVQLCPGIGNGRLADLRLFPQSNLQATAVYTHGLGRGVVECDRKGKRS